LSRGRKGKASTARKAIYKGKASTARKAIDEGTKAEGFDRPEKPLSRGRKGKASTARKAIYKGNASTARKAMHNNKYIAMTRRTTATIKRYMKVFGFFFPELWVMERRWHRLATMRIVGRTE
jgi:hypothetical protein